jgi:hypothetical protein
MMNRPPWVSWDTRFTVMRWRELAGEAKQSHTRAVLSGL